MVKNKYSIISAVNNIKVFEENLFLSPDLLTHDFIVKTGYTNICKAYNDAIRTANYDILIFVHQDVFLPSNFFDSLDASIKRLNTVNWGVLGPAGRDEAGRMQGSIMDRGSVWGNAFNLHAPVQTLDELCLVIKKDTFRHISFDEKIENQHLFGTDICLHAEDAGFQNFAVLAFCNHNSSQDYTLPISFETTSSYIKEKWRDKLPIYSTCQVIV